MNIEDPAVAIWRKTLDQTIHDAAEQHLIACFDAFYAEEEGLDETSPAYGPFCGCHTCIVREVLTAAWLHVKNTDPTRALLQREWD